MSQIAAVLAPRFAVPERLDAGAFAAFEYGESIADFSGATMGTQWSVRAVLPLQFDTARARTFVQNRLDGLVAQMSHWDSASLLSGFNAAPAGSWFDLPRDFAMVMAGALEVAERSGGMFDPALGRVTDSWGLGPRPAAAPPGEPALTAAREASGWRRLALDREAARLRQPGGLWLDLSGIAKGYAADAVADGLTKLGVRHALVEVGGECVGRGLRPDGDPWWIELEKPPGLDLAPLRVALCQLAVATSGEYLRGAHAIDPTTGYLPADGPLAVSVIHRSCMVADAWAGAFAVMPETAGRRLAEEQKLAVRAITRQGREWLSGPLQAMLD